MTKNEKTAVLNKIIEELEKGEENVQGSKVLEIKNEEVLRRVLEIAEEIEKGVWMQISEAAKKYGFHEMTLRNWIEDGIIDAIKVPVGKKHVVLVNSKQIAIIARIRDILKKKYRGRWGLVFRALVYKIREQLQKGNTNK